MQVKVVSSTSRAGRRRTLEVVGRALGTFQRPNVPYLGTPEDGTPEGMPSKQVIEDTTAPPFRAVL